MVCSTFYSIKAVSVPCGWAYRPLGIGYEGLMPQCLPATLVGLVSVYALYSDGKKNSNWARSYTQQRTTHLQPECMVFNAFRSIKTVVRQDGLTGHKHPQ